MVRVLVAVLATAHSALAALPPGPGPWTQEKMLQPVPGAARALTEDGWKTGKLCDVSKPPYSAKSNMNATAILTKAIEVLEKYYKFMKAHNAEKTYAEHAGKDSGGGNLERHGRPLAESGCYHVATRPSKQESLCIRFC